MSKPLIYRATFRNYKSIALCKVDLRPLMFLVGPNGAGKSNFLDAFGFVSDSLNLSLDHALRERGTIKEVRHKSGGHPNNFSIHLDFSTSSQERGHYGFEITARSGGGYSVRSEVCQLFPKDALKPAQFYKVKEGEIVESSVRTLPAVLRDRLLLVGASGFPEFRPVFDALSQMEIYNLNPHEIARMQQPDPGDVLWSDGGNSASVLRQLPREVQAKINQHMSRIVPGISAVEPRTFGYQETIEFFQNVAGQKDPWRFPATAMSDGTLRAVGMLLAVFQFATEGGGRQGPRLIGLEEPEMALHPAAVGILLAALREATRYCQILLTSHSPDLLDDPDIPVESLLAADAEDGVTRIGPIDEAGREMLQRRLFTAGELLRKNQLARERRDQTRQRRAPTTDLL